MTQTPSTARLRGVSARALGLGLIGCVIIAAGEPFGVLVLQASPLAADFSTGAALFLFFLLTLIVNPAARLLTGSRLRAGELATVYIMMIVAAAIPSWGFTMNLIPLMGGFHYFATPENEWANLILPHLPDWLLPEDPQAPRKLFEGAARGEAIAWGMWFRPLAAWTLFIVTLYFVTLCVLVMLRKQWVERERLLFPLAILPLQMTECEEDHLLPPIFRSGLMWFGFSLPTAINSLNALHAYHNIIPPLRLSSVIWILRDSIGLNCTPRFEVIGLSYLLTLDVSFGIWFFAFMAHIQTGLQRMMGWNIGPLQPFSDPAVPSVAHMALGALVVLVLSGFWYGRAHLKDVWRRAVHGAPDVDDSAELFSYRTAVFGGIVGFFLALAWLMMAGLNLPTAAVFLFSALFIFVGLARIVSQTGLAYGRAAVAAPILTVNALGTSMVGPAGLATLGLNFAWAADIRTFVMASAATGMKMADVIRLEYRRLFIAIVLAVLITLVASYWAVIKLGYVYGGINLGRWHYVGLPQFAGAWVSRNLNNPTPIHTWHLGFAGLGAVLMSALTLLKNRFIGFPIHPIGLTLGLTAPAYRTWFSVFIAWVIKAIVLKYGGANLYMRLRPFFLGLALGAFTSGGFWIIIDSITGMTGNIFTVG